MAVANIDLRQEIQAWKDAVLGRQVRSSNVSGFEKIQSSVNDTVQEVNAAAAGVINTTQAAQTAIQRADNAIVVAQGHAQDAKQSSVNAQSWAVGGTGSSTGEDADNSRYYSLQSKTEAERADQAAARATQ